MIAVKLSETVSSGNHPAVVRQPARASVLDYAVPVQGSDGNDADQRTLTGNHPDRTESEQDKGSNAEPQAPERCHPLQDQSDDGCEPTSQVPALHTSGKSKSISHSEHRSELASVLD